MKKELKHGYLSLKETIGKHILTKNVGLWIQWKIVQVCKHTHTHTQIYFMVGTSSHNFFYIYL